MRADALNASKTLKLVHRPDDVIGVVGPQRMFSANCEIPILTTFAFDDVPKKTLNGMKSPWISVLPSDLTKGCHFGFVASSECWEPGTAYNACRADGRIFRVETFGHCYSPIVDEAFGIYNPDAWEKFAKVRLCASRVRS